MLQEILYLLPQLAVPVLGIVILSACFISLFSMRPAGRPKAVLVDKNTGEKKVVSLYETSLGRSKSSDIVIDGNLVSRSHAVISRKKKGWFISDTNSKAGTFVNGEQIERRTQIFDGDTLSIGGSMFTFVAPNAVREDDDGTKVYKISSKTAHRESLRCAVIDNETGETYPVREYILDIGRSQANDIVIDDPHVSRMHASVRHTSEGWFIVDNNSAAGVGLNGYRVADKEPLSDGDVIQILRHRFTFKENYGGGDFCG